MGYSTIERPEARYRIVYGVHDRITPASELPSQFDALFLEGVPWRYNEIERGASHSFQTDKQYSEIAKNAQEKNVTIYFGDIPSRRLPQVEIRGRKLPLVSEFPIWGVIRALEASAGADLFVEEIMKKEKISRRNFLKKIGKGAAVAWSLSFLTKSGALFFQEGEEIPSALEKMVSSEDIIHPEAFGLLFRNAVVAKKLISIGRILQARQSRKAELTAVFGAAHTGIAEFLRKGEESCMNVIRPYPQWFLKAMIDEGDLNWISLIIETKFKPQHGTWVISDCFLEGDLYFHLNREREYSSVGKEIR